MKVSSARVDVVDRDGVDAWAAATVDEFGQVNLIFNNAGVALSANVSVMTYESFRWLMDINFWGVVYGTMAFLPHLRASGDGHVVNISSVFGLLGIPTQSAYNATKFAVRGFTEALRTELDIEQCGVRPPRSTRAASAPTSPETPASSSPNTRRPSMPNRRRSTSRG